MNLFTLSLAHIRHQPLNTLLTLLLLIFGVGTIVVLMLLSAQFKAHLQRDVAGIDLVVGAKGSPLQLILSSVYHVDIPTGNILLSDAQAIAQHPMVAATIPLALGDAVQGFRIVGTDHSYIAHYRAELAAGELWQQPFQAMLGAAVAQRTEFEIGAEFIGSHGLGGSGLLGHDEHPFQVVGILKPTGTVLDRLVLTAVESVHEMHAGHGQAVAANTAKEITALLVKYRSPVAAVMLPRLINSQTALQAAAPAFEIARLLNMLGAGTDIVRVFAYLLVAIAALSIFIALYGALQKRQFDLALMRSLGASRGKLFRLLLLEGITLSVLGTVLGILLGHLAAYGVAAWLAQTRQFFFTAITWLPQELYLLVLAVILGVVAALIPALRAYRMDISTVFARRV